VNIFVQSVVVFASLATSASLSRAAYGSTGPGVSGTSPPPSVVEEVIFVDEPGPRMTAIVRAEVARGSAPFAWLLPVRGKPMVEWSSSTVFRRLAGATAPEYLLEVNVKGQCRAAAPVVSASTAAEANAPVSATAPASPGRPPGVDIGLVAGVDYAFLDVARGTGEEPEAAVTRWLSSNRFTVGTNLQAIHQYTNDGFGFLAVRVNPEAGSRPIAVTYEAERPVLPIRATPTSESGELPVRVWVLGPAQAVPINVPSLVLNEARIDWTSGVIYRAGTLPANGAGLSGSEVREPENYDSVVSAAAAEAGGQGFVSELAQPASQFRRIVWSRTDEEHLMELSKRRFRDGFEAIAAARESFGDWDGFFAAERGASSFESARFLRLLRELVVRPVADAGAWLGRAPYLTRLYARVRPGATMVAPAFDYNADLAQIAKARIARQWVECDPAVSERDAPWRIRLPHGGAIAGQGRGLPAGAEAMPANLMIVALSTSGAGSVLEDHREAIGLRLAGVDGASEAELDMPRFPRSGLLIGGMQTVTPRERPVATPVRATPPAPAPRCSVTTLGGRGSEGLWVSLALAGIGAARRRRRKRAAGGVKETRPLERSNLARGVALVVMPWAVLSACKGRPADKAVTSSAPAVSASVDVPVSTAPSTFGVDRLKNPETCKPCHPMHYREWSGSMHAYATVDPVFIAMNARGQRETNGKLGDFCFRCHAPMAVQDGLVRTGLDPRQLPESDRGITCYFCHNVTAIEGNHNGMLRIAGDTTMRGPIRDPVPTRAHGAVISDVFDEAGFKNSEMCGGCHDIVTTSGVHLERTFEEFRHGIFSKSATGAPPAFSSCVSCHMPGEPGPAAVAKGVADRVVHKHLWPGIDVALTDFPHRDAMRSAIEHCELRASVSFFTLEVTPPDLFTFQVETNAGHNQPSGAAQDRRMWLEVSAYGADGKRLDGQSSGIIADDEIEEKPESDPKHDPNLLLFADRIFGAKGEPVHMFWQAERSPSHPEGFESNLLPAATTTYVEGRHAVLKQYRIGGAKGLPARVTARLRIRPIGLDVLGDLVRSGDLDPSIVARMPTFTFGAQIEWTKEKGLMKPIHATLAKADCYEFRCLLDPGSKDCNHPPPSRTPAAPKESLDGYRY
jgi:hypothetical protein